MKIRGIIKATFLIVIIGVVVALNVMHIHFQKQSIEFTNVMTIFRIILTWFGLPILLIAYYSGAMRRHLEHEEVVRATILTSGLLIIVMTFVFVIQIVFFVFFENKTETQLEDGYVLVEYENFGIQQPSYYQQINAFLYKKIEYKDFGKTIDSSVMRNEYQTKKSAINYYKIED